jgi:hypothetical protein
MLGNTGTATPAGSPWSRTGAKVYAENGPDGRLDGRYLERWADGDTEYFRFERGKRKEYAVVYTNGRCEYNGEACAPDDPRLLALIAQIAPVEVRPDAPAFYPPLASHSPPSNRPMDRPAHFAPARRRWRPPWPPRCTPIPARRRWWPCDTTQQQPHCNTGGVYPISR